MTKNYWDNTTLAQRLLKLNYTNRTEFYTKEDVQKLLNAKKKEITTTILRTSEDLQRLPKNPYKVAIDLETDSLDPIEGKIVGIGLCWNNLGDSAYYAFNNIIEEGIDTRFIHWLKELLENEVVIKVFHNAKFDLKFLINKGFIVKGKTEDTQILHYLIAPHESHGLKVLAQKYLGIIYDDYNSMIRGRNILEVPIEEIARYCAFDCWSTFLLDDVLKNLLPKNLSGLYLLELGVMRVIVDMELRGIAVDAERCLQASMELQEVMDKISSSFKIKASYDININSSEQISKFLFEEVCFTKEYTEVNKKGYSTNEKVLMKTLASLESTNPKRELLVDLLEYRKTSKLKTTYADNIIELLGKDNRLRGEFNQCRTATGRLSSSNPNMQNFPKPFRYMFVPDKGHTLIAADYSQCEVRILAYFSKEPTLIEAFLEGKDVHAEVAKKLFKTQQITDRQRYAGKQINFSIVYGLESTRLALILGCSLVEAEEMLSDYWIAVPGVKEFLEETHKKAIALGYSETILGRRRYYTFTDPKLEPYIGGDYKKVPLKALKRHLNPDDRKTLREAGNAPIQGSNADITKLAMVACKDNLKDLECYLLLQIHDELVFTCKKNDLWEAIEIIKHTMSSVVDLGIPLKVDPKIGLNWSELVDV